ncbi:VanZ family protein [Allomeiothermus silvanus]|uniref:VanZ family protein n=1 Tax=Allomeiothermus silvanus TaxID=52022 RepID=UPI0023F1B75A|nr:VanZ family protein [Allomeiothermus silvanus]
MSRPLYLILALGWMGVIFYFSSQSGDRVGLPSPWDKFVHAGVYGLLGWLLGRGSGHPASEGPSAPGWRRYSWGWAIAVAYGLSDEFHQSFVPGRQADALDLLADSVGAFLGTHLLQKPRQAR